MRYNYTVRFINSWLGAPAGLFLFHETPVLIQMRLQLSLRPVHILHSSGNVRVEPSGVRVTFTDRCGLELSEPVPVIRGIPQGQFQEFSLLTVHVTPSCVPSTEQPR